MARITESPAKIIRRLRELAKNGEFVAIDDVQGPPGAVALQNH